MWITALIFGLLGSFHCVGMCGPIAFLLPVDRENNFKKLFQIFIYHSGRILAYSSIGFLFGFAGKSLSIFGLQQQLSIWIGVIMIIFILLPKKMLNKLTFSKSISGFISRLKSAMGKELKKKTPDTFFTIGFLNGFLPCGLVYTAVLGAISRQNALEGSLYMALFGLGTIPLMTTAVYMGTFLNATMKQHIRKAVPVVLIIMASLFILRGMGLGIPYVSPKPMAQVTAGYSCH